MMSSPTLRVFLVHFTGRMFVLSLEWEWHHHITILINLPLSSYSSSSALCSAVWFLLVPLAYGIRIYSGEIYIQSPFKTPPKFSRSNIAQKSVFIVSSNSNYHTRHCNMCIANMPLECHRTLPHLYFLSRWECSRNRSGENKYLSPKLPNATI